MNTQTDEEIARMVQGGDTESFGLLIQRYEQKMMRYARRFLFDYDNAQDLIQEVFIKVYTKIQSYDSGLPFSPWIYRIAHNEYINAIKKRKSEPLSFIDFDTLLPYFTLPKKTDDELHIKELRKALDACLDKLDAKYREPLLLYYYEELDYKEISEILRVPVSTVGVRLKRGRTLLKKYYDQLHRV